MERPYSLFAFGTLVAALLVGSVGCASVTQSTSAEAISQDPRELAGTWSLVALDGTPVAEMPQRGRPTLRFDLETMRATGFAGVNRFGGSYDAGAGTLTFAQLIMTKMAGPPEQMDLERRFSRALEQTTGWRLVEDHLELLAGDEVVARLARTE